VPSSEGGDDFVRVCGPCEGLRVGVGLGEEAVDGGLEVDDEAEDAAFQARLDSLAKKPSTALSQEHEVGVKWKTKRSCRSSQARTDACGRRSCRG
jgi:hypothetical protein